MALFRGRAESDGYNALVLAAGLGWRDVAAMRALSRYLHQTRVAVQPGLHVGDAGASTPRSRASARRAVPGPLRPAPRLHDAERAAREAALLAEIEDALQVRRLASTRTASCAASSTWCRRRCAPISCRSARTGSRVRRSPSSSTRARIDGLPAAAPALRDLRLFAARRRHSSALRQGGARRPALVRPAAGFPHRDAGPRQGAAGQERRDRAGRRQGRLRAQAPAAAVRSRGLDGGGHRGLPHLRRARCSSSPTTSTATASCRPMTPCAMTATTPISWSPPTRARRPSPTSPTRSRSRRTTGSATPSPRAAARATTTRRWASRPAAPGRR